MKITAIEIKPGMIIEHKNDLWNVLKTQHVKPGKGGAFNQVELKSIMKGTKLNERFRSNENIEKAEVDEKKFNFLYTDGENCHFMDNETYEQVEISKSITGEQYKLLKENLKDKTIFKTTQDETRLITPYKVQESLDEIMKNKCRIFIRPSGTENVVRLHIEGNSLSDIDEFKILVRNAMREYI